MLTDQLAGMLSSPDLPEPPPADPMPLLLRWYHEAEESGKYQDFNAMTLATATRAGVPSARIVLCKAIDPASASLRFFSNYESRKGRELADNPVAAAVFHWPHAQRQARLEGTVTRVSDAESDEYFHSRPLLSRIGACVSPQSRVLQSRAELISAAISLASRAALGHQVQRPPAWGGYRFDIQTAELWSAGTARFHSRVRWQRAGSDPPLVWNAAILAP